MIDLVTGKVNEYRCKFCRSPLGYETVREYPGADKDLNEWNCCACNKSYPMEVRDDKHELN